MKVNSWFVPGIYSFAASQFFSYCPFRYACQRIRRSFRKYRLHHTTFCVTASNTVLSTV